MNSKIEIPHSTAQLGYAEQVLHNMSLPQHSLLFWTDYSGTLPDVQNIVSAHAPDVRSTSNTVSTSFCQGKCLKTKQIIGYIN